MKKLLLIISLLLLTSCGPKEEDFKSDVPIVHRDSIVVPVVAPVVAPIVAPVVAPMVENKSTTGATKRSEEPQPKPQPEINLDVPFFSQAPDANWDLPWQEACEEAASILAYYYATEKPLTKEKFKEEILGLVGWENKNFGDYKDTDVSETAEMIRGYFSFSDLQIIENPTINQMKEELSKGHVIVAPFAGRQLGNPFYSGAGPLYHMMVIRGYDEKNFITNDVGTKRGENFIYPYNVIMSAMHEWNDADINLGAKKVIIFN